MKYYIEKNMSSDIMSIHHGPQKKIVLKLVLWIIRSFQPKITNSKKSVLSSSELQTKTCIKSITRHNTIDDFSLNFYCKNYILK